MPGGVLEIEPNVWINPELIVRMEYSRKGSVDERTADLKTDHSLRITMAKGGDLKYEDVDAIQRVARLLGIDDPTKEKTKFSPFGFAATGPDT